MGMRVLVVGDSGFMRKRICELFVGQGHLIVGEARGGNEAVELFRDLKPDLVTMDITMREMDGITAAKEILHHDDAAQIIFLSNLDEEKYGSDAEQLGAVGYVNKRKSVEILDLINNA